MLRASPVSLNAISYNSVIGLLQLIIDSTDNPPVIGDVYIDTVGDPETYKSRLISGLGPSFGRFTIEKKADATYKVVGAASIIAKVTRDKGLTASIVGGDCGSGYPSDERCVAWLQRNMHPVFGYPQHLVRFSWSTIREVLEKQGACAVEWYGHNMSHCRICIIIVGNVMKKFLMEEQLLLSFLMVSKRSTMEL